MILIGQIWPIESCAGVWNGIWKSPPFLRPGNLMSLSDWRAVAATLLASPRARLLTRIAITLGGMGGGAIAARNHHTAADFDVFWTAASHWQTPYDHGIIEVIKKKMHITGYW